MNENTLLVLVGLAVAFGYVFRISNQLFLHQFEQLAEDKVEQRRQERSRAHRERLKAEKKARLEAATAALNQPTKPKTPQQQKADELLEATAAVKIARAVREENQAGR